MSDLKKINLYGKEYNIGFSTEDFTTELKDKLESINVFYVDLPDRSILYQDTGSGATSGDWEVLYNLLNSKYTLLDLLSIRMTFGDPDANVFGNAPIEILSNDDGTEFAISFVYNDRTTKKVIFINLDIANYSWESKLVNDYTKLEKTKLESIETGAQVNKIEKIKLNNAELPITNKLVDLGNLLKKLKEGTGISILEDGTISTTLDTEVFKMVSSLPTIPEKDNLHKIHVIPDPEGEEGNRYKEYLWDGSKWENIGGFKVDLSEYYTKEEVDDMIVEEVIISDTEPADADIWIDTSNTNIPEFIEEAPKDNIEYVRKNGQWIEATFRSNEVTITLRASDGSTLMGLEVSIDIGGRTSKYTWNNIPIQINVPYGTLYKIQVTEKEAYLKPPSLSFTANRPFRDVEFVYNKIENIGTIFDDSDGSAMLKLHKENTDTSWIRGKRCLAKKTNDGIAICYLGEDNSELFHDGTEALLDGSLGMWLTELPEYWFKVLETEGEGGVKVHTLLISNTEVEGYIHSKKIYLGVTKGIIKDDRLLSFSGTKSTASTNINTFHTRAVANGEGFDIISYEAHCKLAHLFYTKYANRNPQSMSMFGYGEGATNRLNGTTSFLGNNDGKSGTLISFLGVEDPYGNLSEWISGIHSNGSVYYIYDGFCTDKIPTIPYRTIDVGSPTREGFITKLTWGEYGDMVPIEVIGSTSTHYCDYGYVAGSGWRVVGRSHSGSAAGGGFARFSSSGSSSSAYSDIGSRIQYVGEVQIIEDPQEFLNLPLGF